MPPKPISLDGISRPPSAAFPKPPDINNLNAPAASTAPAQSKSAATPQPRISKPRDQEALVMSVLTVVIMILLIALAFLAYNKSR